MRDPVELKAIIEFAKTQGLPSVEIDGVVFNLGKPLKPIEPIAEDIEATDVVTPLSVLDDMDDDEILYWATPYYDEIQVKKEHMQQAAKDKQNEQA